MPYSLETGFPHPFEDQDRADEAWKMDGGRAHLGRFVLALETGDQLPPVLGLLQQDVFQVRRPVLVVSTEVKHLVRLRASHRILLDLDRPMQAHWHPQGGALTPQAGRCMRPTLLREPHALGVFMDEMYG